MASASHHSNEDVAITTGPQPTTQQNRRQDLHVVPADLDKVKQRIETRQSKLGRRSRTTQMKKNHTKCKMVNTHIQIPIQIQSQPIPSIAT